LDSGFLFPVNYLGVEMTEFTYRNGKLFCEDVSLAKIAQNAGTPCFVYSKRALLSAYFALDKAFAELDHLICFAIKSNANLAVLNLLASHGAGMDIVSQGELYRALKAGVPPERIVYSGVGKSEAEIRYGLESGILSFNVESIPELGAINRVAASLGKTASICLRINPDVESLTHEYTATGKKETKFGIPYDQAIQACTKTTELENLRLIGIDAHIGSQIIQVEPFVTAFTKLADLFIQLRNEGFELELFNIGGGLGIRYSDENPPTAEEFAAAVLPILKPLGCKIILEPGRFISGNAGVLIARVIHLKQAGVKNFVVVDAGMNDLIRPSLYNAYHQVSPVTESDPANVKVDIVGPICESGDWLAKDRLLPKLEEGALICLHGAGAYSFTMSSNYNGRPRGAEVLVDGDSYRIVRKAETLADLIRGEEI
jgi:diaminopimelate decarboxylase